LDLDGLFYQLEEISFQNVCKGDLPLFDGGDNVRVSFEKRAEDGTGIEKILIPGAYLNASEKCDQNSTARLIFPKIDTDTILSKLGDFYPFKFVVEVIIDRYLIS
jgi:hypothetical protein